MQGERDSDCYHMSQVVWSRAFALCFDACSEVGYWQA